MIRGILQWKPRTVLISGVLLSALIAIVDWRVEFNATLGFLYIFPLALFGTVLNWWQLPLMAAFCAFLSDRLDPFPGDLEIARDILIFLTVGTTGFLSRAVTSSFRSEVEARKRIEEEARARRTAEGQLEFMIESSSAGVVTMNVRGDILFANPAAHRLLGLPAGSLPGRKIASYMEALGSVRLADEGGVFRTEMQTRGRRENGEVFLADVSFSTYDTPAGPRLSALIVDVSENLREREEASLEQLLAGSRILVAAVSHEVRNVCGAIGMMHENLARRGSLAGDEDFEALGSLVGTLKKIASIELKESVRSEAAATVDLNEVLTDLRIVLGPFCEESDIELKWDVPANLPHAQADRHSLMQVLLNLARNSQRALEPMSRKQIEVSAYGDGTRAYIRFSDSGPGIPAPHRLFQPLQKGAEATGLGLYLSRAFMRSFRGDLHHDAEHPGCSFVLDLPVVSPDSRLDEPAIEENATDSTVIA